MDRLWKTDFAAMQAVEDRTGVSIVILAQKLVVGSLTLKEMAIMWAGCSGESVQDAGDIILRLGLMEASERLAATLNSVLSNEPSDAPLRSEVQAMMARFPDDVTLAAGNCSRVP